MSQSKIQANGVERKKVLAKFELDSIIRYWQQSTTRMMRTNQLVMRGMMGVAKKQMELGQDLLQHRLATMQATQNSDTLTATTSLAKAHVDNSRNEMQRMAAGMREATDDLKKCFSEATNSLFDRELSVIQDPTIQRGVAQ